MIMPFFKLPIHASFIDDDEIDQARRGCHGPISVWAKTGEDRARNAGGITRFFSASIQVLEVTIKES